MNEEKKINGKKLIDYFVYIADR